MELNDLCNKLNSPNVHRDCSCWLDGVFVGLEGWLCVSWACGGGVVGVVSGGRGVVRDFFRVHRVVTAVQVERWGWRGAGERLGLHGVTLTCRPRRIQASSDCEVRFVAAQARWLRQPERELLHHAALAEAYVLALQLPVGVMGTLDPGGWRYLSRKGSEGGVLADAEWWGPGGDRTQDWAVEVDVGYPVEKIREKLRGFAAGGYRRVLWASTIHSRTVKVQGVAEWLCDRELLGGLERLVTLYVDVSRPGDPYAARPRCHKRNVVVRDFSGRVW